MFCNKIKDLGELSFFEYWFSFVLIILLLSVLIDRVSILVEMVMVLVFVVIFCVGVGFNLLENEGVGVVFVDWVCCVVCGVGFFVICYCWNSRKEISVRVINKILCWEFIVIYFCFVFGLVEWG